MIHKVAFAQTKGRYWFATCECGWTSSRVAYLAEAERDGLAHVRENNERPT